MDDVILEEVAQDALEIGFGIVELLDPEEDFGKSDQEVVRPNLDVLLSVDLHHPAKLLVKLLLREHFQPGHLPHREEGAEVNELVGFSHSQASQTLWDLIKWFGSCLEEVGIVSNSLIDVTLSKQGVEDVVTRDGLALYLDCVRNFEAFPHRVVLQLSQELRLNQLYLAKLPQIHVVQHVQPEALLDDLVLPPVLLRVHGLLELKV